MIPLSLDEVAALCPGELHTAPWAQEVTGVQVDSRRIGEGELFIAVGDGRNYWKQALARGAGASLLPDDALASLAALGGAVRARSSAKVIAITGSTGKTSTKDVLAALCQPGARTIAAEASFNNEIGIPLTLCRIEPDTEVAIVEIGMRGLGQIAEACQVVRPHVGVITLIGAAHLELVGSIENVARAKAEILSDLETGGIGVVPADAPELDPFIPEALELRRFGPQGSDAWLVALEESDTGARLRCSVRGEEVELAVPFRARYQASNLLAALLAYDAIGLPLTRVGEGSPAIRFSPLRGEESPLPGEGVLINDAYNANPTSMRASLEHQAERAAGRRRVAVLGTMAELGPDTPRYHREIGTYAASLGVDAILAVGEPARDYLEGAESITIREWAPDAAAAGEMAVKLVQPGDCVLVKGSRAVGLEAIVARLGEGA